MPETIETTPPVHACPCGQTFALSAGLAKHFGRCRKKPRTLMPPAGRKGPGSGAPLVKVPGRSERERLRLAISRELDSLGVADDEEVRAAFLRSRRTGFGARLPMTDLGVLRGLLDGLVAERERAGRRL